MIDEVTIIRRIIAGSKEEYRMLVERYQTGLIIHCENILKDRSLAEDIAQESFVKAYEKIATFDAEKARFSTWLYRIASNKCLDELRKMKQVTNVSVDEMQEYIPEELYSDEKEHLRRVVRDLQPPEYSRVVQAYYWEGKSYSLIAQEFGTNTQTVGTWLRRAKLQLKEALK
jgi:RNA polymerase sigma-70 factor (ECF subfamily)